MANGGSDELCSTAGKSARLPDWENGGQRLYIVPELELVVAFFSGANSVPALLGEMVLKDYVLPAVIP